MGKKVTRQEMNQTYGMPKGQERKSKWDERGKKFWNALLFTKDGKPKSGFMTYTFFFSVLFLCLYALMFVLVIGLVGQKLMSWSYIPGNLVQVIPVSAIGIGVLWMFHHFIRDKRMMLGTFAWLDFFAIVCFIATAFFLKGSGAIWIFLNFYLWFMIIPAVSGTVAAYLLFRRDYQPPVNPEPQEEWQKYFRH